MKKKLLILTNNPVAKIGISSYLSSIFNQYLTIQSARGADITPEILDHADCILLSTENIKDNLPYPIPEHVYQLVCMRTFNHTYLHKILQIPPGSSVYLINDTENNAHEVLPPSPRSLTLATGWWISPPSMKSSPASICPPAWPMR